MPSHPQRHTILSGLLALGLLAGTALTAGPAQAASGVGPFYPEPAWDRKIAPINRFLILTNWASQAVLDKETGLVWERSPDSTPSNWFNARFACTNKTVGNRKGWRLPSFPELVSLVDPANSTPSLPTGNPFEGVQSALYWSAASFPESPSLAWGVHFGNGGVNVIGKTVTITIHAWCVRGGMNAEAY